MFTKQKSTLLTLVIINYYFQVCLNYMTSQLYKNDKFYNNWVHFAAWAT